MVKRRKVDNWIIARLEDDRTVKKASSTMSAKIVNEISPNNQTNASAAAKNFARTFLVPKWK